MKMTVYHWMIVAVLVLAVIAGIVFFVLRSKSAPEEKTEGNPIPGINISGTVKELQSFRYSPGYSDSNGASHSSELKQNENGDWIIADEDRETAISDTIVTTYAVSADAVAEFTKYIEDKNILDLENRPESDNYWLDHSPWGYMIVFKDPTGKRYSSDRHSFGQYQEYSDEDHKLLDELDAEFKKLYGKQISKKKRKD